MSPRQREVSCALHPSPKKHTWLVGALVSVGYVAGGVLGLQLASVAEAVTLVWPPTGVAIAALVVYGRRMTLPVWLGALAVNLWSGTDFPGAALIATGNMLEALLAAYLLERVGFYGSFESRREVHHYGLAAALAAPVVAAVVGASALLWTGAIAPASWLAVVGLWWAGDATGALIVGPLVLTWLRPARSASRLRWAASLCAVAAASGVAFLAPQVGTAVRSGLMVVPVAALVWSALQLGPRGAATACAIVCVLAVLGTALVGGPLLGPADALAPVPLWLFMTTAGVLSLLLTALNAERGSAEEATRSSQARFANAFEHAPIGMAIVTHEGVFSDANPQLARMLCTDVAGLLGESASRWVTVPLEDVASSTRTLGPLDRPPSVDVVDASGASRTWNARVTALPAEHGEPGYLLQAEDVTEALANEASLRALNEQLVHAQRMDSVGNLAGGIAHDFNNLLQAIGANVELARLPNAPTALRDKALSGASDAVQRAAALTNRLLAFSHRSPVQRVPVDVNTTLQRAREMLVRLLPENVTLEVVTAGEPAFALVDETQLDQVLMNLCVNARDAMPDGGRIDLSVAVQGEQIIITSQDEGPGIPVELRERVFEPFFTTKARGQGTGFGLSMVFAIVRAHDGDIRIEDAQSGGARIVITLPRTHERPVSDPLTAATPSPRALSVLLAEDDPLVRSVVVQMLESEGHRVIAAEDGACALERFEQERESVDVLLFDVRMPRMTGPVAMRAIRAQRRDIPAVLMSGYPGDELAVGEGALASVRLLEKPFELAELTRALDHATRGHVRMAGAPT
ncbi:MAG: MASE1 domain-containing protein [Myxococcales bacterium]|nr:MASE1 domain-containing protein [Myxococcales bacterium]MCB9625936.1 MASE1 domain-containing protein [Sandaracinaceae bacterium]